LDFKALAWRCTVIRLLRCGAESVSGRVRRSSEHRAPSFAAAAETKTHCCGYNGPAIGITRRRLDSRISTGDRVALIYFFRDNVVTSGRLLTNGRACRRVGGRVPADTRSITHRAKVVAAAFGWQCWVSVTVVPENWRRAAGRPRTTWTKNIRDDLSSLDLGTYKARELVQNRPLWRLMSLYGAIRTCSGACYCCIGLECWVSDYRLNVPAYLLSTYLYGLNNQYR